MRCDQRRDLLGLLPLPGPVGWVEQHQGVYARLRGLCETQHAGAPSSLGLVKNSTQLRMLCFNFTGTRSLAAASNPELVHARERGGIFRFEQVPGGEIGHGTVLRKPQKVILSNTGRELEADEMQT